MIDADNFGTFSIHFQASIEDNSDIFTYVQALIADNFGISAHIQALIADDFGILNTLGKNKHHPGFELQTSGIFSRPSTNCMYCILYRCNYVRIVMHMSMNTVHVGIMSEVSVLSGVIRRRVQYTRTDYVGILSLLSMNKTSTGTCR